MAAKSLHLRRRLVACVASAIVIAFGLAGCALIPAVGLFSKASANAAPKSGECWNTSNANAANWVDWEGSAARPCSRAHDLYTYAVGTISGVASRSWASSASPAQPTQSVQTKAETACTLTSLLPRLQWNEELVQGFFFLPSKSEWASGARWVRCDVGVLAHGTTLAQEELIGLPRSISTLVSEVSSDPLRFDLCVDSQVPADGAGPLANNDFNYVADCRNNPEWRLAGRGTLPEAVGSPFPYGAQAAADSQKVCSKFATTTNETWYAYLPEETSDATVGTDREVTCWVGQLEANENGGGVA